MSRGKNGAGFRRGRENRTLGWYIGVESNQDRGMLGDLSDISLFRLENVFSATSKRQNSFDSESSNGRQTGNEKEERKRRANKNRNRSQNSQNGNEQVVQNDAPRSNPIPIGVSAKNDSLVGSDQQVSSLQQQLLAQVAVQKENYWYYDSNTDGYFYEFCGSRGWRKRNPKIHGNPLPNTAKKVAEGSPQTIEKVSLINRRLIRLLFRRSTFQCPFRYLRTVNSSHKSELLQTSSISTQKDVVTRLHMLKSGKNEAPPIQTFTLWNRRQINVTNLNRLHSLHSHH